MEHAAQGLIKYLPKIYFLNTPPPPIVSVFVLQISTTMCFHSCFNESSHIGVHTH